MKTRNARSTVSSPHLDLGLRAASLAQAEMSQASRAVREKKPLPPKLVARHAPYWKKTDSVTLDRAQKIANLVHGTNGPVVPSSAAED